MTLADRARQVADAAPRHQSAEVLRECAEEIDRLRADLAALREAVVELGVSVQKARMFVECFETPAGGEFDPIASFTVDIPDDAYPRQWATFAAPAVLAELDAALAAARKLAGLGE